MEAFQRCLGLRGSNNYGHLMIYWVTANLFVLISIRTYAARNPSYKAAYGYILALLFIILWQPVSNGGSNSPALDPIDDLLSSSDDDLLNEIQRATFQYFWNFAHPTSGMARERNTSGNIVTSGGSGFGIMAIIVGIHRQFISREEGMARIGKIINFLARADRFHGAWPHWLDGNTGKVIPFSTYDDGGDLVETAFMMQGLLTARAYFNQDTPAEDSLRTEITSLWEEVDWNWYRKQVNQTLFWHWSPNHGFAINLPIRGWNETMIVYILGIASPTHSLPASTYAKGWASNDYENDRTFYGYKLEVGNDTGGPLFFAHYSFLGLDPREKRDNYTNYFFQGRNQTLVNRAWCIENTGGFTGYGSNCWGLTASDDPDGYKAHAPDVNADNGTITPSAAISSIAYTPAESIAAIRHFLSTYREKVWGEMGFYDAFNPSRNWYADSYLAIDQGPIICMIENYRSGVLWQYFMQNEEVLLALDKIGFVDDKSTTASYEQGNHSFDVFPNPSNGTFYIRSSKRSSDQITLIDLTGKILSYSSKRENDLLQISIPPLSSTQVIIITMEDRGDVISRKIILNPI